MSVSDLTGTKWVLKSTFFNNPHSRFYINFTSNSTNFTSIMLGIDFDEQATSNILYFGPPPITAFSNGGWANQAYRIIEITGGSDATNSTLISWLEANATQVDVVDLSGTEWVFGSSVSFANSSQLGTYAINYGIVCNDTTYNANDGTALTFAYTSEYFPPVDKLQQIAYITINTSNYRDFGGMFYQSNGRIFESSYADTLTYPVTLHNTEHTSGTGQTYVEKISITDGTDTQNPDLIAWLSQNATIQESSSPSISIGASSLSKAFVGTSEVQKIIYNGVTLYELL